MRKDIKGSHTAIINFDIEPEEEETPEIDEKCFASVNAPDAG